MLDILLGVGDTAENKNIKILAIMDLTFQVGETDDKENMCLQYD